VQVDPIKPKLKAPGIKRLKLKCGDLRLNYAFKFNLRCYMVDMPEHSISIKPVTSSFIDVRDLPGQDGC